MICCMSRDGPPRMSRRCQRSWKSWRGDPGGMLGVGVGRATAGRRIRGRTITVQQLGPRPQAPETAPTAPVGRPLAEGPPPNGPHVDTHCRKCFTGLPDYLMYLGLCGDCLQDAKEAVRTIP